MIGFVQRLASLGRRQAVKRPCHPGIADGSILYVIGDIHGRVDLLTELITSIETDQHQTNANVTEIYLGDYVDRGPNSREVIELLLKRATERSVICLRGNHEALLLEALEGQHIDTWLRLGGAETVRSYGLAPRELRDCLPSQRAELIRSVVPPLHIAFLANLPLFHRHDPYLFVHAGIRPNVPLPHQSPRDLLWIREPFLSSRVNHEVIVVHGHSPRAQVEVMPNRINIDTGAYATNRLTCLRIDRHGPSLMAGHVLLPKKAPTVSQRTLNRPFGKASI